MFRFLILLSLIVSGCSSDSSTPDNYVTFTGREPERVPLYRVMIPKTWEVVLPDADTSLTDSRLPLLECRAGETLRIVFHNFPASEIAQRIPPQAQIERWKKQLEETNPASVVVTPQAFSGYTGLLLEAEGKRSAVMGWALQIGADHYRNLSYTLLPEQMRADITIKATGSPQEISQYRSQLINLARTFELIEEIPVSR